MRIAAPALMVAAAGGGLSKGRSNDDAANDVLVVQVRAVGTISRSFPQPAARAALTRLKHDPENCEAVFRKDHAQTIT
jgi:hypothetical protein